MLKVEAGLNEGKRALQLDLTEEERDLIYDLHLLTMKPMLYIANVDEEMCIRDSLYPIGIFIHQRRR